MGYTHYWDHKGAATEDAEAYELALSEVRKVVAASPVPLAGGFGDVGTKPELDDGVRFNGVGHDSHETLSLRATPEAGFDCCKTARKPYDVVVTACLAVMADRLPTFTVSSDGDELEDWKAGCALASEVLGRPISVRLDH